MAKGLLTSYKDTALWVVLKLDFVSKYYLEINLPHSLITTF